jgi:superfamily II DNA or RNA helicase
LFSAAIRRRLKSTLPASDCGGVAKILSEQGAKEMSIANGTKVRHPSYPNLGIGTVRFTEVVGGRENAAVRWPEPIGIREFPVAELEIVREWLDRLLDAGMGKEERFQLRVFGRWFEARHALSGELSNRPFEMLPHQIVVAKKVADSLGKSNPGDDKAFWLLADDVGLGKTIEAGMIMEVLRLRLLTEALEKREREKKFRCLILTPAGLVNQWKEELLAKFGRRCDLFNSKDVNMLEYSSLLICSIDLVKRERGEFVDSFKAATPWDLLIIDEAHHLATDTNVLVWKLANRLIVEDKKANVVLFLTATPHSGNRERFYNMIRLLRRDLFRSPEDLIAGDGRINHVMIRNRKSQVQDAKGHRLFNGVNARVLRCRPTKDEVEFAKLLYRYLKDGYRVKANLIRSEKQEEVNSGRGIGFLMAMYQKLASSSPNAIRNALKSRKDKLDRGEGELVAFKESTDDRYQGEEQEKFLSSRSSRKQSSPIINESKYIGRLLTALDSLDGNDSKLRQFLDLVAERPDGEKVLIFTEYLETQKMLQNALEKIYPGTTDLINGSMSLEDRKTVCKNFNTEGMAPCFLVSTEAGGEGLNMQKACHIVVNYDLPWNPARLQQRIGRIYRYGQTKPVQVINLRYAPDGLDREAEQAFVDGRLWEIIEDKIEEISKVYADLQMAAAREAGLAEHDITVEDVREEVLGAFIDHVKIDQLYEDTFTQGLEVTNETLVEKSAQLKQIFADPENHFNIFKGLKGFNLEDYRKVEAKVSTEHLDFFVRKYFTAHGVTPLPNREEPRLLDFPVPDDKLRPLKDFARRVGNEDPDGLWGEMKDRIEKATVDKELAQSIRGARLLRFGDIAFNAMVRHVQSADFHDVASLTLPAAALRWKPGQKGLCALFDLRVKRQGEQVAIELRNELPVYAVPHGGEPEEISDTFFDHFLHARQAALPSALSEEERSELRRAYDECLARANKRLEELRVDAVGDTDKEKGIVARLDDFALARVVAE